MESNLFIVVSEEQQEVVAGGASYDSNSFFNQYGSISQTALTFAGGTTSTAAGTTTGTAITYNTNDQYAYQNTGGGTKISVPFFYF